MTIKREILGDVEGKWEEDKGVVTEMNATYIRGNDITKHFTFYNIINTC